MSVIGILIIFVVLILLSLELALFTTLHDYAYIFLVKFINCATQTKKDGKHIKECDRALTYLFEASLFDLVNDIGVLF